MPTKTKKHIKTHGIVTEDTIIIRLTKGQAKLMKQDIRKSGVAKFKVEEIKVRAIPSVRVAVTPVHCP
jgi:ribosomal protein L9